MSATITYTPIKRGTRVHTNAPSRLIDALDEAFDNFPCTIGDDPEDIPTLRGIAAAGVIGAAQLADAIEKHGPIRVEASD